MKLYNNIINDVLLSIEEKDLKNIPYDSTSNWKKNDDYELLFKKDTKVELGASPYKSVQMNFVTSNDEYFDNDEILLIGKDIPKIDKKSNYARIALLRVDDMPDNDEAMYKEIKNLEFVKYNMFLDGVMMRASALDKSEQIRISNKASDNNFNFSTLGSEFINRFKENPLVKNVKMIFITDNDVDMKYLIEKSEKSDEITRALNTVLHGMNFDCQSCNLKPICDEVEGMRELHFSKKK